MLSFANEGPEEEYGDGYDFERLAEQVDDFWEVAAHVHRVWIFDLEARSAAPASRTSTSSTRCTNSSHRVARRAGSRRAATSSSG